jgi:hypothetical protein
MEKLNGNRCGDVAGEDAVVLHLWGSAPRIELTEHGPVAWRVCGRCPARCLHDPETEDGFPEEPVVVYPPNCFEEDGRGFHPWDALKGLGCGCPRKASGDLVHLRGCVEDAAQIERQEPGEACLLVELPEARAPEPATIVHPPTDPPAPCALSRAIDDRAEVIRQLMEDTGWTRAEAERELDETLRLKAIEEADDEPPTLKRPTPVPVESAGSLCERVESLFGRPFKLGDAAFDAIGGIER